MIILHIVRKKGKIVKLNGRRARGARLQTSLKPYFAVSVEPNFAVFAYFTPLNPPEIGGKFSPPPREGELEGVNLDLPGIVF